VKYVYMMVNAWSFEVLSGWRPRIVEFEWVDRFRRLEVSDWAIGVDGVDGADGADGDGW